jgi:hypothetical protein
VPGRVKPCDGRGQGRDRHAADRGVPDTAAFLRTGRRPQTKRLVVCAGDSITRGHSSADWVGILQRRFAADGYQFVNAGPPPYRGRFRPMLKASLSRTILHRSWDRISASNGLIVLVDQVHLNDRAATVTAGLVADFVTGS